MASKSSKPTHTRVRLKRILAPTDFSPLGNYAVEMAGDYAKRFNAQLTLVHVMAPYFRGTEADILAVPAAYYGRDLMGILNERLEELAKKYRAKKIKIETVLTMGVPFQ